MNDCRCYRRKEIKLGCGHIVCEYCLQKVRSLNCPECNQELKGISDYLLEEINQNIQRIKKLHQKYKSTPEECIKSFLEKLSYEELQDIHMEIFGIPLTSQIKIMLK